MQQLLTGETRLPGFIERLARRRSFGDVRRRHDGLKQGKPTSDRLRAIRATSWTCDGRSSPRQQVETVSVVRLATSRAISTVDAATCSSSARETSDEVGTAQCVDRLVQRDRPQQLRLRSRPSAPTLDSYLAYYVSLTSHATASAVAAALDSDRRIAMTKLDRSVDVPADLVDEQTCNRAGARAMPTLRSPHSSVASPRLERSRPA